MRDGVCRYFAALTLSAVCVLICTTTQLAQAQTYKVLYAFSGRSSSAHPIAGLTIDRAGNLYGTTAWGGVRGEGTAYEMKLTNSGYIFVLLHSFMGGTDGDFPIARPTIGPNGVLYGTTAEGGTNDRGTVYSLKQSNCGTGSCPWTETVLYRFTGGSDGRNPWGGVVFDKAGNMYGTDINGGDDSMGVAYELSPGSGGYMEKTIYTFTGGQDGASPLDGLTFDAHGNLYGTTSFGALVTPGCGSFGCGTIFELQHSASGWTEKTLYSFEGGSDGAQPQGGVIFDSEGNLYGGAFGGTNNGGTVFDLTSSGTSWTFNLDYDLSGGGPGPADDIFRDAAGNLYGTTWAGGAHGAGNVFKLTPSGGGWTYTSLHDFTNGTDGGNAGATLVMDSNGNLYGVTYDGGSPQCGCGVVFEITP